MIRDRESYMVNKHLLLFESTISITLDPFV